MTFCHVDNSMTTIDFAWLVLNHAVQGRKASVTYSGPYPGSIQADRYLQTL